MLPPLFFASHIERKYFAPTKPTKTKDLLLIARAQAHPRKLNSGVPRDKSWLRPGNRCDREIPSLTKTSKIGFERAKFQKRAGNGECRANNGFVCSNKAEFSRRPK